MLKRALLIAALALAPLPLFADGIVNGGSGGGGTGTVTSIATACGVSGGPITTTGTISGAAVIRAATGTTDTILSTDCGKVVTESNAAAVAVTLPQATGAFTAPFFYTQVNLGAGTVTITPTTSTINGAATLVLTTGQSADISSDGTNYVAALGKGATTDASLLTSGTLAAARLPAFTGNCIEAAGTGVTVCDAPHPGYIASNWYMPGNPSLMANGQASSQNKIVCRYAFVPNKVTIGALGARLATVGTTNFQLAIYANASGRPSTLIGNTGNIVNTSTAAASTGAMAANKQVGPGGADGGRDIWWCSNNNDGTAVFFAASAQALEQDVYAGSATASDLFQTINSAQNAIQCTGAGCTGGSSTFGSWPATLAGSTWVTNQANTSGNQMPLVIFQAASVP